MNKEETAQAIKKALKEYHDKGMIDDGDTVIIDNGRILGFYHTEYYTQFDDPILFDDKAEDKP